MLCYSDCCTLFYSASGGRMRAILNTLRMSWAEDLISIDCKKLLVRSRRKLNIKIYTYIAQNISYELLSKCSVLSFSNKKQTSPLVRVPFLIVCMNIVYLYACMVSLSEQFILGTEPYFCSM